MSTQHTPGEWRISGISQEDGSISIAKNQIVICCVTNAASIFEVALNRTAEAQFANAHLIAAAPDMHEALKSMRAYLSKCPPHAEDRTGAEWGRMMDLSGAALARAEGKS